MCKNAQCAICIYGCKDMTKADIPCENLTLGLTLEEILEEIKNQNVNLRRLAKQYYLKYPKLMDMLHGKMDMHYKYRVAIMNRLQENPEYEKYYERFEVEDGER